jgi:hypothetical protein
MLKEVNDVTFFDNHFPKQKNRSPYEKGGASFDGPPQAGLQHDPAQLLS